MGREKIEKQSHFSNPYLVFFPQIRSWTKCSIFQTIKFSLVLSLIQICFVKDCWWKQQLVYIRKGCFVFFTAIRLQANSKKNSSIGKKRTENFWWKVCSFWLKINWGCCYFVNSFLGLLVAISHGSNFLITFLSNLDAKKHEV